MSMSLQLVNYLEDADADQSQMRVGALAAGRIVDFERVKSACATVEAECDRPEHWQSALGVAGRACCLQAARGYYEWFGQQDDDAQRKLGRSIEQSKLLPQSIRKRKVFTIVGH